jgi:hypothetical protein
MANVTVRKDNENRPAAPASSWEGRWEPFRMMRDLMGWDPFREMAPFAPAMPAGFIPSFEVKETKDAYTFKADLPGNKEEDLEISPRARRPRPDPASRKPASPHRYSWGCGDSWLSSPRCFCTRGPGPCSSPPSRSRGRPPPRGGPHS